MAFWGFLFSHQEDAVLISVLTLNPRPSQAQGEAVRESYVVAMTTEHLNKAWYPKKARGA